ARFERHRERERGGYSHGLSTRRGTNEIRISRPKIALVVSPAIARSQFRSLGLPPSGRTRPRSFIRLDQDRPNPTAAISRLAAGMATSTPRRSWRHVHFTSA